MCKGILCVKEICVERLCVWNDFVWFGGLAPVLPFPQMPKTSAKKLPKILTSEIIIEALCACHLASYVTAPVLDRGGIMIVGPPGALKTTFLAVLDSYHNTMVASALNTQTLMRAQQDLATGSIRSIVVPDLHAIYAGDPRTAARVESSLMQLAGEGLRGASWQDTRHQHFVARATVFGAMTATHFERHAKDWEESGFLRRFLWVRYQLLDAEILMNALERWERADFGAFAAPALPASGSIHDDLTSVERATIRGWLKHQPRPHEIQYSLFCRATAALRWCYKTVKSKRNAMDTMKAFSQTLQRDAAQVQVLNRNAQ